MSNYIYWYQYIKNFINECQNFKSHLQILMILNETPMIKIQKQKV